jgi:hypothetical protein
LHRLLPSVSDARLATPVIAVTERRRLQAAVIGFEQSQPAKLVLDIGNVEAKGVLVATCHGRDIDDGQCKRGNPE